MLSDDQLATVRAALQYWREEICPSGGTAAEAYFDVPVEKHLSACQVLSLQRRFEITKLRYVPYNRSSERIAAPHLFTDRKLARGLARDGLAVGTVLLG